MLTVRCRACRKIASLKHFFTGCEYALRSYTWRHNEAEKIYCETVNKSLNSITNRAIHFVKGNISKLSRKNKHRSSLLDGCTDWHVATDLEHHFVFPTEISLITQRPDIVIWSVKAKSFRYWVNGLFWRKYQLAQQHKLEKYGNLQEQCVRNGWITTRISYRGWIVI